MNDKNFEVYDCVTQELLGMARGIRPESSTYWCLTTEDLRLIARLRTETDVEFRVPGGQACMRFKALKTTGDGVDGKFKATCVGHEYLK